MHRRAQPQGTVGVTPDFFASQPRTGGSDFFASQPRLHQRPPLMDVSDDAIFDEPILEPLIDEPPPPSSPRLTAASHDPSSVLAAHSLRHRPVPFPQPVPSMNEEEAMGDDSSSHDSAEGFDSAGSSTAAAAPFSAADDGASCSSPRSPPGGSDGSGNSCGSDDSCGSGGAGGSGSTAASAGNIPLSQRPLRRQRAVAAPVRLDASARVVCYRYAQGRASSGDGRWQGTQAHLHYYMPENWSPSYKFTVFEDSYILSLAPDAASAAASAAATAASALPRPTAYFLARPLHGASPAASRESPETAPPVPALPVEFELVWPVEVDRTLLETVECACDRVVPGAKRKPQFGAGLSLQNAHLKLQKLAL